MDATVSQALPNAMFEVELENGHKLIAYAAGRMRRYFIRITPGDRIPAILSNRVLFRDGVPVARKLGGTIEILSAAEIENSERRTLETALVRRPIPERLGRPAKVEVSEAR